MSCGWGLAAFACRKDIDIVIRFEYRAENKRNKMLITNKKGGGIKCSFIRIGCHGNIPLSFLIMFCR